jgi:hypothetical protein
MGKAGRWSGSSRLLLLLAPLLLWLVDYHATDRDLSFCLFKLLTGHRCYGCGLVRGLSAVLHGDLRAAWDLNHLNAVTIPLLGYLYFSQWLLVFIPRRKIIGPVHPLTAGKVREINCLKS